MILDRIVLKNFGLYAGSQVINLTPPSPNKPVVLIGGLNGGGKTTFLDALQLCLFGPHAKISNRGTLGYREYLSRSIHRGRSISDAAIEVSFRHSVQGHEEQYSLHRSWHRNKNSCSEKFEVKKNGVLEPVLADNWSSQVEEIFPANIAHLFLFDGEQAEAFAAKDESSALIGSAIQNLLGLDIVDQLQRDLLVYERRKRSEDKADPQNSLITSTQTFVHETQVRIDELLQERAALRTHRIDRCKRALQDNEDAYRKAGGDLFDRKEEIEKKWLDALEAVRNGERELRELASGPLPLALIQMLLDSMNSRDEREEASRRAHYLAKELKARDRATLNHLRSAAVNDQTIDMLESFLVTDRKNRLAQGKKATELDISPSVRRDLHSLLSEEMERVRVENQRLLDCQSKAKLALSQAKIEWDNVPEPDAIAKLSQERENLKREFEILQAECSALGEEIEKQKRDIERWEQKLTRLIEVEAREEEVRQDRNRTLQHSMRVRITLDSFRRKVVERHVRRIEGLILDCYRQLLRKSALVTRLTIDPNTLSLTLFGRDGNVLDAERLSAGERQLLAIALLWALAKASGRPLPTAIDTPLGRLDSGHRLHLVERYIPFASHQVVLLSTDEEISGECLERLNPWIGRTYRLAYDDNAGETQILPGYFGAEEAA